MSYRAEGRVLFHIWRSKKPIVDIAAFHDAVAPIQKDALTRYCSDHGGWFLRSVKAIETQTFYGVDGERLMSFSVGPSDCGQW